MKVLFGNKKTAAGIVATMVGVTVLLAGLSLAWFTSTGSTASNNVTMRNLDVIADVHNYQTLVAQPGIDVPDQVGYVQNLGNLPTLVKLSFDVSIERADGTPGDPALVNVAWQIEGSNGRQINDGTGNMIEVHPMGFWMHSNNIDVYMWGEYDGDIYVAMQGPDKLHFAYTIATDGQNMGNEYQGAKIQVAVKWEATQLWADGAIYDTFGIDFDDISWFADSHGVFLPGLTVFSLPIDGGNSAADLLDSIPDSSFRRLLEYRLIETGKI